MIFTPATSGIREHRLVFQNALETQPAVKEQTKEAKENKQQPIESANTTNTLNMLVMGEVGRHQQQASSDTGALRSTVQQTQTQATVLRQDTQQMIDQLKTNAKEKAYKRDINIQNDMTDVFTLSLTEKHHVAPEKQDAVYKDVKSPHAPDAQTAALADVKLEKAPTLQKEQMKKAVRLGG